MSDFGIICHFNHVLYFKTWKISSLQKYSEHFME